MLKFYSVTKTFEFRNCIDAYGNSISTIIEEPYTILSNSDKNKLEIECSIERKYEDLNWSNIIELCDIYNYPLHPVLRSFKTKEVIGAENIDRGDESFHDFFINKEDNPDMIVHCSVYVREVKMSINEILNWPDGDKAIQYLVERGMKI